MTPLRHIRTLRCMHTERSASLTAYSFPQATPLQSRSPPDVHAHCILTRGKGATQGRKFEKPSEYFSGCFGWD